MSNLARYFKFMGIWVGGYDRTSTPLTREMEDEGMDILYDDEPNLLPGFLEKPGDQTLIIYTPSIPAHNRIKNTLLERGFELNKRSLVLGKICANRKVLAVAGTHGKTTTSTLLSHLLKVGGIDCISFLGGISTNYKTNFLPGYSPYAVVEADEYDRSFLTLFPDKAIITSMDADHLDIYGTLENMVAAFNLFANQVKEDGFLLTRKDLPVMREHFEYTLEPEAAHGKPDLIRAKNIRVKEEVFLFDYLGRKTQIKDIPLHTPGYHNIENALAAITLCLELGIPAKKIKKGMDTFTGVKRRFEYLVKGKHQIYIDDYAHHQDELTAFLKTVRLLYPQKHIAAIFQPHLFSRTRDFFREMAQSLSLVDELFLMNIYPAREEPMEGISSQLILDSVSISRKWILEPSEILSRISREKTEVVLTIGAGDVDKLVKPLQEILVGKEVLDSEKNRGQEPQEGGFQP